MADGLALAEPDPAFRQALRELTAASHRSLDHHPILMPLVRSPLSVTDYARALQALHGPQAALESELDGFATAACLTPRLTDLEDDLAGMHCAPFPLAAAMPALNDDVARLGALYVIEGSNLGGLVIARQLITALPPDLPRAFFARAEGRPRWERFWQFAGARLSDEALQPMADAANQIFAFYRVHLDGVLEMA